MAAKSTTATKGGKAKPMLELGADLSPAVSAIEKAYRMIQRRYKDAPDVTIVIKRDERAWGHTTIAKVWAPADTAKSETPAADRFEIMISGENLRRGAESVAATLVHEAAHARNLNNGIRDCDSNGRHNTKFKDAAEAMGLTIGFNGWHGWTLTEWSEDGLKSWRQMVATIEAGLRKAAVALPHTPITFTGGLTGISGTGDGDKGGTTILIPPKRGNRNLLKATCGCGNSLRISRGAWEASEPTCQACGQIFALAS